MRATRLAARTTLLATGLLLTACASPPPATTAPPSSSTTPSSTTPSAISSTPPPPPPAPAAADGTNYRACQDGNCEILLTGPAEIPLGSRGRRGKLVVKKVNPNGVDFDLDVPGGGGGNGTLNLHCTALFNIGSAGGGMACPREPEGPPAPRPGIFAVQRVHGAADGATILRLVSP